MKNDNTQSRANKKFNPMSCVLRNYIIKILDHPRFTEISNSKVPGKLIKNISMITDKIIFVITDKISQCLQLGQFHGLLSA